MASNPPLNMEDQTDEDFFDKLVEDDFEPTMSSSLSAAAVTPVDRCDPDNTKAFANLSIGDSSFDEELMHEEKKIADPLAGDGPSLSASRADENSEPQLVESHYSCSSNGSTPESNSVMERQPGLEAEALPRSGSIESTRVNGSGGSGVKVVDWNSFYVDSTTNSGPSGLDFFSELGNNAADFPVNTDDSAICGDNTAMGITQAKDIGSDNPVSYVEYRESQLDGNSIYQTTNGHDSSDNQYWENLYPGWKYDPATGQWYQVDNHEQSMNSLQSDGNSTTAWCEASGENTEVAYLRHSSQSVMSTIAETSTTQSISNWNQDSQANGSYPDHMIFDPQYPGWYYDTIAQEWHTLDSYNALYQSVDQIHDLKNKNGCSSVDGYSTDVANTMLSENGQIDKLSSEDLGSEGQHVSWTNYNGIRNDQITNSWQPEIPAKTETVAVSALASGFGGNQQADYFYGSNGIVDNFSSQHMSGYHQHEKASQGHFESNGADVTHNFVPDMNVNHQFNVTNMTQPGQMGFSTNFCGNQQSLNVTQQSFQNTQQYSYGPSSGRSPDGRPPHAIVTFGFGGKLILMKDNNSFGSQTSGSNSLSILNVMEAVAGGDNLPDLGAGTSNYFSTLCHQSFPGPLAGGSVGSKDLHKWIDERMPNCESIGPDHRKEELLKLLFSVLKIACQHYGKLRSPFGTDTNMRESDTPEAAVAKLFASVKNKGMTYSLYGALSHCLQHIPQEEQLQMTASEVQNLLVSGRKMEALQCAQEGQLWGPALIIAAQLGEQFYVDTVKQMALRQLTAGSPLRTLCLLIAGQPAEVFASNNVREGGLVDGSTIMSHQNQNGCKSMLDEWEENLAVITANRTKDDELVITHLGDCMWKDRNEIIAAHICYIIAEMNFEPYSDTARLCLIGADHWKFPRTYASPEAIQRTELYEYSKVLGNSQYMLLPFQPYKIIYAHMLAEVGKLSDAMKYCQVVQKSLKTGRAHEVDMWKQLVSSLEERIRIHQQGGFSNLAPAKLVGKLLNFFDSTAHRVVGGLPPPAPTSQANGQNHRQGSGRVSSSQSTMAISSLMPSASMEPINSWDGDRCKMMLHNRSVSEPDFSKTPRQDDSSAKESSGDVQGSDSGTTGTSGFSRFGFLQKTVDLVRWSRGRQAKLGEENKFYYDENLKRWVEKGVELPANEPALAPPPMTAAFQNGNSDFGGMKPTSEMSPTSASPGVVGMPNPDSSSGMPPIPSSSNQFSARGRMGVRARYVDTFNQGRPNAAASTFKSPAVSSVKPHLAANANFFIPTTPIHTEEPNAPSAVEPIQKGETLSRPEDNHNNTSVANAGQQFQTPPASSAMTIQRFPSMGHIRGSAAGPNHTSSQLSGHSRRTASWGGSFDGGAMKESGPRALGEVMGLPHSAYMNGHHGDELQDVEL